MGEDNIKYNDLDFQILVWLATFSLAYSVPKAGHVRRGRGLVDQDILFAKRCAFTAGHRDLRGKRAKVVSYDRWKGRSTPEAKGCTEDQTIDLLIVTPPQVCTRWRSGQMVIRFPVRLPLVRGLLFDMRWTLAT